MYIFLVYKDMNLLFAEIYSLRFLFVNWNLISCTTKDILTQGDTVLPIFSELYSKRKKKLHLSDKIVYKLNFFLAYSLKYL